MNKKSSQFDKFKPKKSNAAIKEQFKQEKRKIKKEREAYFENKKREQRSLKPGFRSELPLKGKQQNRATVSSPISIARPENTGLMPLNKFIAHAGVAARREAAEMVRKGIVKVNKKIIIEPGYKVSAADEITINEKKLFLTKNLVYILLNKPKDFITTTEDPQGRKTVLDIIGKATSERVYPVGRLDRNTSGVLLFTNDGELAQKLTHPSNEIKKVYHVTLNKPLEKNDFDKILKGINLEDGPANVDVLAYADIKDKTQIGVEIHSGRNRIVRRLFEALGYDVKNLDRVIFAGLTKKNIERGKWRFLSEKEVRDLKHFGKGK